MRQFYSGNARRPIARFLLLLTTLQTGSPFIGWALTSGPTQPEFSGFESVSTKDMVNKFTGDFAYTLPVLEIPGPGGSSYPVTLGYRSGANVEDESSWVGYGWNLSPGTINRSVRGLPDDFNNEEIICTNKVPEVFTLTTGVTNGVELFSGDLGFKGSVAIRYNNSNGFGYDRGFGISLGKGLISLDMNESDGRHTYSASVNPIALLTRLAKQPQEEKSRPLSVFAQNVKHCVQNSAMRALTASSAIALAGGNHGVLDHNEGSQSTQISQYSGGSYNVRLGASVNFGPVPIGVSGNVAGSYSYQKPLTEDKLLSYGYLYSAEATNKKNGQGTPRKTDLLTDYYTEKDSPYNRRDVFLGVPFANADSYSVSGEGIGGSFQLHHDKVGEFSPNYKESVTDIYNLGADISVGWTSGFGVTGSAGRHTLEESSWSELDNESLLGFSSAASGLSYFRFTNDLGGTAGNDLTNDMPVSAGLTPANKLFKNSLLTPAGNGSSLPVRSGQGSHIGQHTVAEANRPVMYRYCKRADIDALRERPETGNPTASGSAIQNKAVAEFRVTNESGQQYTYGLPVYSRKETTMQYGVQGTPPQNIKNNFLVYSGNTDVQTGQTRNGAYATSYLLTDITTPDYVDRNMNGPDANDFGSYTTFSYVKRYGGKGAGAASSSSNTWYHWRLPYTGHQYEMNSLSDSNDDMGTVAAGEKEICYLQAIHTKTHTAIFSTSRRLDGYDASADEMNARQFDRATGNARLDKLDRIDLYANSDVEQVTQSGNASDARLIWQPKQRGKNALAPIKTVYFNYDYSLCQGTPNSAITEGGSVGGGGKLTLLSITTAYNGVVSAAPYQFKYTYPDYGGRDAYPARYANFEAGYTYGAANQNPTYQQFTLDAWGDYQDNNVGAIRHSKLQFWPDQRGLATDCDPAAWQLKCILLPSGGQIHVQYEPDDYAYVQDKTVHALAELSPSTANVANSDQTFVLDPTSVGVGLRNNPQQEIEACAKLIREKYVGTGNKIFFKFLYKLVSSNHAAPVSITDCNTDYISGYVTIESAAAFVDTDGKTKIKLTLPRKDWSLPKQVCQDFVQTQRLGRLQSIDATCNPAVVGIDAREQDITKLFRQFTSWISRLSPLPGSNTDLCAALAPGLSYFRIPLPTSKRGGGLRVKRLLTYDKGQGLDNVPVLYGSEYEYKAYDELTKTWRSSGVATTEPSGMREENALVEYIPRLQQGDLLKIIAGPDRKQSEGPLGESILPAASVGYSRVTVKNIHSGTTNPGYTVSEFFTCKDAPMRPYMSSLIKRDNYNTLNLGLYNSMTNDSWATQGFSFVLNNMHGQPRREATYAGDYSAINTLGTSIPISEQIYQYEGFQNKEFNPGLGNQFIMQSEPEDGGMLYPPRQYPGKEVELAMAQRAVRDRSNDVSIEWDGQFTPLGIFGIPWPTATFSLSKTSADLYTHTTSKIIRYPAIVRQVISAHDGMRDTTENLAFDRYTGSPVAVRTSDGARGGYLKQNVMASWVYPQVQGRALNEGLVLTNAGARLVPSSSGLYLEASTTDCTLLASIRKGDVIGLGGENDPLFRNAVFFADAPDIARKRIRLYPYFPSTYTVNPQNVAQVSIIFSGNSNELQMQVGSTTYNGSARRSVAFTPVTPALASNTATPPEVFALALQTAIRNLSQITGTGQSGQIAFNLGNGQIFDNINVSGFADRVQGSCQAGMSHATVSDLMFIGYYEAPTNSIRVQLVSFKMLCGGSLITIN